MTTRSTAQMSTRAVAGPGTHAARESAPAMACVEVVFYKEILDHRGFPHRCGLMRVSNEATGVNEATAGAILEFEKAQRVSNWIIAADCYELQQQRIAA